MRKFLQNKGGTNLLYVAPIYIFTILFVLGPLIYMLVLSFLTPSETWGVTNEFTVDNYINMFDPVYLNTYVESLKLALITTVCVAIVGYPMGYFMAKLPKKWKKIVMVTIMIPFWTSALIRLYGWMIIFRSNGPLDKLLMALGITEDPLKLLYTYPAVVVGMVYALTPFMIFSVYSSAEKLDFTLIEAARDLGASATRAFFTIAFKLTIPGLLSGVILTFVPSMGLFFISDILGGSKVVLIGNIIQEQLTTAGNWPFAAALSVGLMILTSTLIFLYKKFTGAENVEGLI